MNRMVIVVLLLAVCLAPHTLLSGCARHLGPHPGSTAAPPLNPESPAPLAPVVYSRTVKAPSPQPGLEAVAAAYAKQGNPKVGVAFYRTPDTIVADPRLVEVYPYDKLQISVESAEPEEENVRIDLNKREIYEVGLPGDMDDVQLISWSEIQQEVFNILLACNFHVTDPEISTLTAIDSLLGRKREGVSQHTAELEQLRQKSNVDVLILVNESEIGSKSGLYGRIWDLRTGRLIGAHWVNFLLEEDSRAGRILARRKARELVTEMLQQSVQAWAR